jgi:hypothetical protein
VEDGDIYRWGRRGGRFANSPSTAVSITTSLMDTHLSNLSVSTKTGLSSFSQDAIFAAREGIIRCLLQCPGDVPRNANLRTITEPTFTAESVILPHSESLDNEEEEAGNEELEDEEIERLGEDDEADAEVLAGLVELSNLCEQCSVAQPRLSFTGAT